MSGVKKIWWQLFKREGADEPENGFAAEGHNFTKEDKEILQDYGFQLFRKQEEGLPEMWYTFSKEQAELAVQVLELDEIEFPEYSLIFVLKDDEYF